MLEPEDSIMGPLTSTHYGNRARSLTHGCHQSLTIACVASVAVCLTTPATTVRAQIIRNTIALSGQDAKLGNGEEFFGFFQPEINASGQTLFVGNLRQGLAGVNNENAEGYWSDRSGALKPIARAGVTGPLGPGLGGTEVFDDISITRVSMNDAGHIALSPNLEPGRPGVWVDRTGNLEVVVHGGHTTVTLPGGNVTLRDAASPYINRA